MSVEMPEDLQAVLQIPDAKVRWFRRHDCGESSQWVVRVEAKYTKPFDGTAEGLFRIYEDAVSKYSTCHVEAAPCASGDLVTVSVDTERVWYDPIGRISAGEAI